MKYIFKILISLLVVFIIIFGYVFILRTNKIFNITNNSQSQNPEKKRLLNTKKPEIKNKENDEIKMIAVGDIMLSREVERKMIEKKDFTYPFLKIKNITSNADITFGNLESPILNGRIINDDEIIFRANPKSIQGLKLAGFNVMSIANNHIMNFGRTGLESTIKNLDKNDILHIGAGLNKKGIYKPALKKIRGTKFAFLGFTYNHYLRKYSNGNIYGVADMNIKKCKENVKKAKAENDIVIVSMHAGTEYKNYPNSFQKDFAHNAIDAGADLVIGHHPHIVQTVEKYKGGYIIYSLGNFVFDQMWSNETRLGMIAKIIFKNKKVDSINFIPIKIQDYSQPEVLEGEEKDMILKRLIF